MFNHVSAPHYFSKGDTIVEVVLAIAVVASLLAGAFSVTSSSSKAVRDSEEHAQALNYLQGQVELLRAAAEQTNGLQSISAGSPFCIDSTNPSHTIYPTSVSSPSPNCLQGLYQLSITCAAGPCAAGASTSTFDFNATWPSISGGNASVYLSYKVAVN